MQQVRIVHDMSSFALQCIQDLLVLVPHLWTLSLYSLNHKLQLLPDVQLATKCALFRKGPSIC